MRQSRVTECSLGLHRGRQGPGPSPEEEGNLQSEQEELLGRDERPAPRAQEVHQVALTEEDKMSQDQQDGAARRLCLLQVLQCLASVMTQPLGKDFVPKSKW